jgi:cell division protein FtsA
VLTGGGSQLRQLDEVFVKLMPSMRKPRVVTEPACGVVWNEPRWKHGDGSQLALLSVLAKGDENCCELKPMDEIDKMAPEDQDKVVQQSLFTDEGESAQDERDRKEQEERRKAEEAAEKEEQEKPAEAEAKGGKKKNSFFKNMINNFMNYSEGFFDDKDETTQQ